jgi:superfamily II DNA or RNA helicase
MYEDMIEELEIEYRQYQERVVTGSIEHYNSGIKSLMIESPTGSGKTVMGQLICKKLEQDYGMSTGWVAMRRNVLSQAVNENKRIGIKNFHPISMFDKSPPKVDILVVDEGHHDSTDSCMHIHNMIRPKFIIGMTATPFRTDRMRLCFEKVVKDAGVRALVDQGYLSSFHHHTIRRYTPRTVAEAYLRESERWGKSLMFFLRIQDCYEAADILKNAGVKVDVVTGNTNREEQLKKFEDGETDVICNVYVLTEGFDCPNLRTVFVRPSGKLPTVQMAGRVLRKHESLDHVNVVQSEDTRFPFTRLASAEKRFIREEDEWRSMEPNNEMVVQTACKALMAIARVDARMPNFITARQDKGRRNIDLFADQDFVDID